MSDLDAADAELAQLRDRVLKLGGSALSALEKDLTHGSLDQRREAIRMVAPFLLRSLETRDDDSVIAAMKDSFEDLVAAIRSAPDAPTRVTGYEPGQQVTADSPDA